MPNMKDTISILVILFLIWFLGIFVGYIYKDCPKRINEMTEKVISQRGFL